MGCAEVSTMLAATARVVAIHALLTQSALAATNLFLASPDGRCRINVTLSDAGALSYQVRYGRQAVILNSPLGVVRSDQAFESGLSLEVAGKTERRRETYELFAGSHSRVDSVLNQRSFMFRNGQGGWMVLDLVAGREGVAFRYRFPETAPDVRMVRTELTGFAVPPGARGWLQPYHAAGPYTPAYEDFYFNVAPGDPPPHSRAKPVGWCFPALFQVSEDDLWALITESGTDGSYCGCHLRPESPDGLYRIAFPMRDEFTKGQTNSIGPEPRATLPWTLPWRVIMVGSARELALSTLVTDLAPPSELEDTSWIIPGRASWAWWAYPDGPNTPELFNRFSDFAAEMRWEYTLFDAGWWKPGLDPIANYARSNRIAPLAWAGAGDFYGAGRRQKKLSQFAAAGVRGVKADFWCSDRQESIATMHGLFRDAAAAQLVVNLHGCTLPRGWHRTWPNFLTAEAVLGAESYMFEPQFTDKAAELNTILPFTRNVVGPMDYTPVGCSPKRYARKTTAAHELATAVVFSSGLIHYADSPEFLKSLPVEAQAILRDAPARWDETQCLGGVPGREVIMARRSGPTWYIAGLNGTTNSLPVNLDLSGYKKYRRRTLVTEGSNALMEVTAKPAPPRESWSHDVPPRGGFIMRLER